MSTEETTETHTTLPTGFPPLVEKLLLGQELSRHWFPIGKGISRDYVKSVCGIQTYKWSDCDYEAVMKKMKKDKLDVFSYNRGQLESRML